MRDTDRILADIDTALPLHDVRQYVDMEPCGCDSGSHEEPPYVCEMCFTYTALSQAKREIERLTVYIAFLKNPPPHHPERIGGFRPEGADAAGGDKP